MRASHKRFINFSKILKLVLSLGLACAFTLSFSEAIAAPNYEINYQGKLTDSTGSAVADGTYNMRFWLLTSPSVATTSAVWTESLTSTNMVQVTNGLFSVMLGSTTPLTSVDFNQTLYLGVEVGGTGSPSWDGEMTPRKILGAVPAAFEAEHAADADTVGGVASTSFLRSDQADTASGLLTFTGGLISQSSSTIANLTALTATTTNLVINNERFTDLTGTGLQNNSGVLTLNTTLLDTWYASSTDFDTSAELLAILTDETGTGNAVFSASPTFTGTINASALTLSSTLTLSGSAANIALGGNYLSGDGGDEGVYVTSDGKVGIGTSTPTAKLSISAAPTMVGSELITNGSFTGNATGWTLGTCASYGSNQVAVTYTGSCGPELESPTFTTSAGSWYRITFDLVANANDGIWIALDNNSTDGGTAEMFSGEGTHSFVFQSDYSGSDSLYIDLWNYNDGASYTIDNVSVREISSVVPSFAIIGSNNATSSLIEETYNTFSVGRGALGGVAGIFNTVGIGYNAGSGATNAGNSTFVGFGAGTGATFASDSNFFGANSGVEAASAHHSNFLGQYAGFGATNAYHSNFFGYQSGYLATGANYSNFFGRNSGNGANGVQSANFFGDSAGQDATQADRSNFFGLYAGYQATSSYNSNFFGENAGYQAAHANRSNFFGGGAGYLANAAAVSNFIGQEAGANATNASNSNFLGWQAGSSATNALSSLFVGFQTGYSAANASYSVFLGERAGYNADNASNSLFLGSYAGYNDTVNNTSNSGSSIAIGRYAGTGGFSNSIALGRGVINSSSTQLNIGNLLYGTGIYNSDTQSASAVSAGRVGIGTSTPNQKLSIFANGADAAIEFSTVSGANEKWTIGIDDSDGGKFKISSSSALGTNDRFVIDGSGRVGIGISSPAQRFTVALGSSEIAQFNDGTNASAIWGQNIGFLSELGEARITTRSTSPLAFFTGGSLNSMGEGTERMRILNTGEVGIGTSTPTQELTVSGDIRVTGRIYDSSNSGGTNGYVLKSTGTGFTWVATSTLGFGTGTVTGTGSANRVAYWSGASALTSDATFTFANSLLTAPVFNASSSSSTVLSYNNVPLIIASDAQASIGLGGYTNALGGDANTAVGYYALNVNTTGSRNTALGQCALCTNATGTGNVAIGDQAMQNNEGGSYNAVLGKDALRYNEHGTHNVAFGYRASENIMGNYNIGIGGLALTNSFLTTDTRNIAIGYEAGYLLANGSNNLFLGHQVGNALTAGSNNILIGYDIDLTSNLSNRLNIGNLLFGTGIDGTGTTLSSGNIGIGTSTPSAKFTVAGTGLFTSTLTAPYFNASGTSTTLVALATSPIFQTSENWDSVFLGFDAASGTGIQAQNSFFVGANSGNNATNADGSNFIGYSSGSGATNADNSNFFGEQSGYQATNAEYSNFSGYNAGYSATNASYSNFFGYEAGRDAPGSFYSNFIGESSGYSASNAFYSNFFGVSAGGYSDFANSSNFIGFTAGYQAPNAATSTFIGYSAGYSADNASNALFLGSYAGYNDTVNNTSNSGSSIAIGRYAGTGGFSNSIALGRGVINSAATQLNIGNLLYGTGIYNSDTQSASAVSAGRVGIGTSTPNARLSVSDTITADEEIFNLWDNSLKRFSFGEGTYSQQSVFTINQTNDNAGAMISFSTNNDPVNAAWSIISYEDEFQIYGNRGAYVPMLKLYNSFSSSTGNENVALLQQTIGGQSGTAGYTGLKVDITESAVGSGNRYLANFLSNSTSRFVIEADGNVGIGTSSPMANLHIRDGSSGVLPSGVSGDLIIQDNHDNFEWAGVSLIAGNSTGGSYIDFGDGDDANIGGIWYQHDTNAMYFNTNNATAMTLSSAGNVGIGTSTPTGLLDVVGNSFIRMYNSATQYSRLYPTYLEITSGSQNVYLTPTSLSTANWGSNYSLYTTTSGGVNNTNQLYLRSNNNIGFGTTTPNQALTIFRNAADAAIEFSTVSGANEKWTLGIDDSDGAKFKISSSSALGTNDRFVIDGSGNIGLGTNSPERTLTITDDTNIWPAVKLCTATTGCTSGNGLTIEIDGDGGTHGDAYIWNYENRFIQFGTNDVERMTIAAGGNVGIGTTTPQKLLDVVGTQAAAAVTSRVSNLSSTGYAEWVASNNGSAYGALGVYGTGHALANQTILGTSDHLVLSTNTSVQNGGSGSIYFMTGGWDTSTQRRMIINASGNVGIGTTSPSTRLHVASASALQGTFTSTGANRASIRIQNATAGQQSLLEFFDASTLTYQIGKGSTNGFFMYDATNARDFLNVSTAGALTLQGSAGNVGIGTTTPNQKLSIFASAADAAIEFGTVSGANEKWTIGIDDSDGAKFKISSSSALGTNDRFVINGAGNVGIGTTTPSTALAVAGTIRALRSAAPTQYIDLFATGGEAFVRSSASTKLNLGVNGNNMTISTTGNIGIGTTTPSVKLEIDTGSNTSGLRLLASAETTAIGDMYVGGVGQLVLSTAATGDTGAFIEVNPEDDEYGFIVRDSSTGGTVYSNFYMNDAATDYLNINVGATNATAGLVLQQGGNVGIGNTSPTQKLTVGGNVLLSSQAEAAIAWGIGYNGSQESITALTEFNGYLYAGQGNGTGDGDVLICTPSAAGVSTDCDNASDWATSYDGAQEVIWSFAEFKGKLYAGQGSTLGTPQAGDGDIFVCNPATTGDTAKCDSGDWSTSRDSAALEAVFAMAEFNGRLYAVGGLTTGTDGDIYVCNPDTAGTAGICDNASDWTTAYDGAQEGFASLAVFNGRIYAAQGLGSGDGDIYASSDGTTWAVSYNGAAEYFRGMSVYNGKLYAAQSATAAGSADVYMTTDGVAWTMSFNGSQEWLNALTVYNGSIYTAQGNGTGDGDIFSMTGSSTWATSYNGSQEEVTSFAVYNGKLYAGQGNGTGDGDVLYMNQVATTSYALKFAAGNSTGDLWFAEESLFGASGPNGEIGTFKLSHALVTSAGAYDVAEDYPTADKSLMPGDIVSFDPNRTEHLEKATKEKESLIAGVVSGQPGFLLSSDDREGMVPTALVGRVEVKVSDENGPIEVGDSVTISSEAGVGMKANFGDRAIGYALAPLDANDSDKTVLIYVSTHYAFGMNPDPALFASASSSESQLGGQTIIERLAQLASGFVDGVLSTIGINTERVNTATLCVGTVCVDEATFLNIVEQSGGVATPDPIIPDPVDPVVEDDTSSTTPEEVIPPVEEIPVEEPPTDPVLPPEDDLVIESEPEVAVEESAPSEEIIEAPAS